MNTHKKLSFPIYEYVRGVYKGKDKSLGEIASAARIFEFDMNNFLDMLEFEEGLIR